MTEQEVLNMSCTYGGPTWQQGQAQPQPPRGAAAPAQAGLQLFNGTPLFGAGDTAKAGIVLSLGIMLGVGIAWLIASAGLKALEKAAARQR